MTTLSIMNLKILFSFKPIKHSQILMATEIKLKKSVNFRINLIDNLTHIFRIIGKV